MNRLRVGLLGCGDVSDVYLRVCKTFPVLEITACANRNLEKARRKAEQYGVPTACGIEALLADPGVDVVLNLTAPSVHAVLTLAALEAGKHVYSEKPLATDLSDSDKILEKAARRGLRVGCAPDTFLGSRLQACRAALDRGAIGDPVAATAFVLSPGHEWHHPDPEFFYKPGGGPLLDMGPYYLTALVALLGPATRCCGMAKTTFRQRTIPVLPRRGERIDVEVATHVAGTVEFQNGAIANLVTSFDVWDSQLPRIEIYGTEGTLSINDPDPIGGPNLFGGPTHLKTRKTARWRGFPRDPQLDAWEVIPVAHRFHENCRGLGLAEMACAIRDGRPHRASGAMAHHVLEIMHGLLASSGDERYWRLRSTCERPSALPVDFVGAA